MAEGEYTEHEEVVLLRRLIAIGNYQLEFLANAAEDLATMSDALPALATIDKALTGIAVTINHVSTTLDDFLTQWEAANTAPPGAAQAVLTTQVGGNTHMAITVDTTNGNAVLGFDDDKGDPTGPPPGDGSGLVVTFASDNPAVATLGDAVAGADAAGNVNYSASVTPLTEGTFNLSAVVANASGAALTDADGTTAFVQPTSIAVPVSAGQAASGNLSVTP